MSRLPGSAFKLATLGLVLVGIIIAVGVQPRGNETGTGVLPTAMMLPTQPPTDQPSPTLLPAVIQPTALPPTLVPTDSAATEATAASPTARVELSPQIAAAPVVSPPPPEQPVPNQVMIRFEPGTTLEQRNAYIQSIGGAVQQKIDAIDTLVVALPEAAASTLPDSPFVMQTEPDYYVIAQQSPSNDPLFGQQWALPVMYVPEAWPLLPANSPAIAVAVIDSGICAEHPDLAGRILPGYDFIQHDTVPQDEYGHGCGVAGVIAANANNNLGIAGVAPNTRIIPLRVLDHVGLGVYSNVVAAIIYAADNGAQIINLSLGGTNPSTTLENAVNYAIAQGALVVAAAGNTGGAVIYPAAYAPVVAVASVDQNLARSSFSSYGPEVDLLAPGRDIMTTRMDGQYAPMTGTSFAAPQVAALAALEMAHGRALAQDGGLARAVVPTASLPTATPEVIIPLDKHGNPVIAATENQRIPTDTWAVILEAGSDPNVIAAQLGYENLGQIGASANTYLFRAPSSSSSPQAAQDTASSLQAVAQIVWFEQQFAQQQFTRTPNDEPLYDNIGQNEQWHLRNTFPSGVSLNLPPGWVAGTITGDGIQIAIVDDGLQHTHRDLAPNYNPVGSYDYNGHDNTGNVPDPDPAPITTGSCSTSADCHGTAAAGVAAAADNPPPNYLPPTPADYDFCGVGVAYGANLAGIRLIAGPSTPAQEAAALIYRHDVNDIYSNSWGPLDNGAVLAALHPFVRDSLLYGVTNGRVRNVNGEAVALGSIYVWAAGNGRENLDNVNADGYANSRFVITVAATDYLGRVAYYSEPGAPNLVAAPSSGSGAGVATTDLMGTAGYNTGDSSADYIFPNMTTNNNFGCTKTYGGTSAATPMVAGVVALMLQANPNLTWRDVQHILVETAAQTDATNAEWTLNGAGRPVNHNYGFGLVDASAAVSAAQTWTNVEPEVSAASPVVAVNQVIPDNNPAGVSSSLVFNANITIEHVEVVFNAQHSYRGDIEVLLTSPDGTTSRLMEKRGADASGAGYSNWIFSSVRHWGEHSAGTWTLKVSDGYLFDQGVFQDWQLRVYGTPAPPKQPTPITPADGLTINTSLPWNTTNFSWDMTGVVAAEHIQLQLDTVNPPVMTYDLAGTAASEVRNLPLGTYYWRVRAVDDDPDTTEPDWATIPVRTITIRTPDNNAPTRNYFTTATPTLSWTALTWATGYEVQVSASPTFAGTPVFTYQTFDPAVLSVMLVDPTTLPTGLGEGVYHFRVRGRRLDGTWSPTWSLSDSFVIDL